MLTTERIKSTFGNLQPREEWSFRDVGRSQTTAFTHDYHRYPAKFIPQIVRKLIEDYAPNSTQIVCGPFGGCGTTLVEAKLLGHKSIGFGEIRRNDVPYRINGRRGYSRLAPGSFSSKFH